MEKCSPQKPNQPSASHPAPSTQPRPGRHHHSASARKPFRGNPRPDYPSTAPLLHSSCTKTPKTPPVSPFPATLTRSSSRNPFVCHSYENTRDGIPPPPSPLHSSPYCYPANPSSRIVSCPLNRRFPW